ncbi:MAG: hypothetical protein M1830_002217 [Pleopsidium flavum]|nr:MAG: hypothetical protein M1830_002217 [Pleopsidium flavum]
MDAVVKEQAKLMKQPATRKTVSSCPAPTGPATYRGQKNRCYVDDHDSDQATFGLDAGYKSINTFCDKHKNTDVGPGSGNILDRVQNGDDSKTSILLRMTLDTTPVCQKHDNAGKWTIPDCRFSFARVMNGCDTTSDNKNGGDRTADCITYSIQGSRMAVQSTNKNRPPSQARTSTTSLDPGQLTRATSNVRVNDPGFWMTLDEINNAVNKFCVTRDKGVSFQSEGGTPLQSLSTTGDHPIKVSATWRQNDSCKKLQSLNFSKSDAADTCKKRLGDIVNTCNPSAKGNKYWKAGGSFFRDCITWDVRRDK